MLEKLEVAGPGPSSHAAGGPGTSPPSPGMGRARGGMNVIIPMGGIGLRFAKEGYRMTKPMVNIVGRPMLFWILDNLDLLPQDTLWIALMDEMDANFSVSERVKQQFPKVNVKVVPLKFATRGAAETLFIILRYMNGFELSKRTISLDCDTIYFSNVLEKFRALPEGWGTSLYFEDSGERGPIYSYIDLDAEDGRIQQIKEKKAISTHANTGGYGFPSGHILKTYCARVIDGGVDDTGEYYTSSIIGKMIANGENFRGIFVPSFECVGTPAQLRTFLGKLKEPNSPFLRGRGRMMRFCFDLDGTLVTHPAVAGDYSTCQPIERNIKLLRELKAAGHHIIIYTARRMRTCKGNVGGVLANVGMVTFQSLADLEIPYDEVHFGKPYADVYIDDLAVNAYVDTEKEVGWHIEGKTSSSVGAILPRHFNDLQIQGDVVIKTMQAGRPEFNGEQYFYSHVPEDIKGFFPKLVSVSEADGMQTITMERVPGIVFSYLLVNRCVTESRLALLLNTLRTIHTSAGQAGGGEALDPEDMYANYYNKVWTRYQTHMELYSSLPQGDDTTVGHILHHMSEYEAEGRGKPCKVIHGDPVFSNVLLQKENDIKLIDMRGCLGQRLTLEGDAMYDLAKVYQSLCGYDYFILDQKIMPEDEAVLTALRAAFDKLVQSLYGGVRMDDVKMITAAHLFSCIPMHVNNMHQLLFWKCCQHIVSEVYPARP